MMMRSATSSRSPGIVLAVIASMVFLQTCSAQTTSLICNNTGISNSNFYDRREGTPYCYKLFQAGKDYSDANRTCFRENGILLRIDSEQENEFVYQRYFVGGGRRSFWLGLDDQEVEGVFKWVDGGSFLDPVNSYSNWTSTPLDVQNSMSFDCVEFAAEGWRVHQGFCASSFMPFVCRQLACNSTDGLTCDTEPEPVLSVGIIILIVVIVLVIIIVAVVIALLLWVWKYHNDAFYRYICCCVYGGTKTQVHSLQQENQRLRHELSQQKLSLSGRFSQGQLGRQQSQGAISPTGARSPVFPIPEDHTVRTAPTMPYSQSSSQFALQPIRSPSIVSGPYGALQGQYPAQRSLSVVSGGPLSPIRTILPRTLPTQGQGTKPFPTTGTVGGPVKTDRPHSATSHSSGSSSSSASSSSSTEENKPQEKESQEQ